MTETAVVKVTGKTPTLEDIHERWTGYPKALDMPNKQRLVSPVDSTHLGREITWNGTTYRFVEVVRVDWTPPANSIKTGETFALTTTRLTGTRTWRTKTAQEISDEEAARKLAEANQFLTQPQATLLFELAKQDSRPTLTQAQFATWVRDNWP